MAKRKGRKAGTKKRTTRKATRKSSKKVRRGIRGRRAAAPPAGASHRNAAMNGLLQYRAELLAEREQVDAQLEAVEHALGAMGGSVPAARVAPAYMKRPGPAPSGAAAAGARAGSLKDYIVQVMNGQGVMRVRDITDGVRTAGYPTRNKTLAKSVGIALTEMPRVAKVGRGQFRLK